MKAEILICDDEEMVRELVAVVMEMEGHKVVTAANGEEALQIINSQPERFGILFTDHKMPGINGVELVAVLRTIGFAGRIIVLSGRINDTDIAAYQEFRVDQIIRKPFDFSDLKKAVSGVSTRLPSSRP